MQMQSQDIAKVCYEAHRGYCLGIGDSSQPTWEYAPLELKDRFIHAVEYLIRHPNANPEDLHSSWVEKLKKAGWSFGTLSREYKTHPSLLPYNLLSPHQRIKDYIFKSIVNCLS